MPISFSEVPFFRLVLAFIAGILLFVSGTKMDFIYMVLGVTIFTVLIYLYKKSIWSCNLLSICLLGLMVAAGYYRTHSIQYAESITHFSNLECPDGEYTLSGTVLEVRKSQNFTTAYLAVDQVGCESQQKLFDTYSGKIQMLINNSDSTLELQPGQTLTLISIISDIPPARNPHVFSFKAFLEKKKVYHRAFVGSQDLIEVGASPGNLRTKIHRFRTSFIQNLETHTHLEQTPGLITGIVLGDKSIMNKETYTAFRDVGAAHVLAVSGLHVGIVFSILFLVLKHTPKYVQALITLIGIWAFIIFAGAPPSAMRAGSMFSLFSIGQLLRKRVHPINILSFCAFIHLFYEPNLLRDVGFQFSYMALLGIVVFYRKINTLIPSPHPWVNPFRDLASLSVAAQMGVLPLSIYFFNQASPYFMLSSIFSVLGAYIILIGGLLTGLMGFVFPALANLLGFIMDYCCLLLSNTMWFFTQLPGAAFKELHITSPEVVLIYGLITIGALMWYRRITYWKKPVLMTMCLLIFLGFTTTYEKINGQAVVIYSVGNEVLIDVFSPKKMHSIQSRSLTETTEHYAASANRLIWSAKNRDSTKHLIEEHMEAHLIKGRTNEVLIISNGLPDNMCALVQRPYHLVLTKMYFLSPEEMEQITQSKPLSITAGGATSRKVAQDLQTIAEELEITFANSYLNYHKIKNF
nr:ComEC family competence protein [Saprospiraceae bacterium]